MTDELKLLYTVPVTEVLPSNSIWILLHRDLRKTACIRAFVDFMVVAILKHNPLLEGRLESTRK